MQEGKSPIHIATDMGWTDILAFLVKAGADVEIADQVRLRY
jgi:hypothetical protein